MAEACDCVDVSNVLTRLQLELKKLGQDIKAGALEAAVKNKIDAAHLITQVRITVGPNLPSY